MLTTSAPNAHNPPPDQPDRSVQPGFWMGCVHLPGDMRAAGGGRRAAGSGQRAAGSGRLVEADGPYDADGLAVADYEFCTPLAGSADVDAEGL